MKITKSIIQCGLLSVGLTVLGVGSVAAETSSENNQRLRDALKKFPEADTDKDGILTMTEARAWLAKNRGSKRSGQVGKAQNPTIFKPSPAELDQAIALGRKRAKGKEPLQFEKGKGLRIVMTGHSWVAPGRKTLPAIAAAAGFDDHRQRAHLSGGGTGAANAIWLKEFGKWNKGFPQSPILIPAIATGEWDVMTWGGYYNDKTEYFGQWIDLCLKYNPDMVFYLQDGWPRFEPGDKELSPAEYRKALDARIAKAQTGMFKERFEALEKRYPGKVRMIPASLAVVDLIHQYLDGEIKELDCVDERSRKGKRGIYRDGGHLSRNSGIEHLVGYLYYGMLYRKSPATIKRYAPANVPPAFDRKMREAAWRAIVESPFAGIDDDDQDGVADDPPSGTESEQ